MNAATKQLSVVALAACLAIPMAVSAEPHGDPAPGTREDNTGKNVRDRDDAAVVPTDQAKGSDQDVETTRNIRKAIVADDNLSTNAHNVKIVTLQGIVTLRGPVASEAEKTRVAALAAETAGSADKVKNLVHVAP
ncbi:MAG: BON domain-containing protein [Candidatus Binatia bacterium]